MKKFIRKFLTLLALCAALFGGISCFILFGLPEQFGNTYQHALYLQVQALPRIKSPKIVVVGDSSVPFSLDCARMSGMMKEPVQTLGIHSGTGAEYVLNLAKDSIRKGDIMVLELAPDQADDSFSPSIVLTACENHFEMYRCFTLDDWEKVIRYYPTYLAKKVKYYFGVRDSEMPPYSIRSFNADGNFIYRRLGSRMAVHLNKNERDTTFSRKEYDESLIVFLNNYNSYCTQKGATFLITFSPFLDESLAPGASGFTDVQNYLSHKLQAPVITKISARELPRRYFYNNAVHCNTAGAEKVTEDLAHEIRAYLNRGKQNTGRVVKVKSGGIVSCRILSLPVAGTGKRNVKISKAVPSGGVNKRAVKILKVSPFTAANRPSAKTTISLQKQICPRV